MTTYGIIPTMKLRHIKTPMTDGEYGELRIRAITEGMSLSQWIRETILGRLKQPPRKHGAASVVKNG